MILIFLTITLIGTAKPEEKQSAAKAPQTAAAAEKAQAADEEKKKEAEKVEHKCSEECLKKCLEKGEHKCSEEGLRKCIEGCLKKCEGKDDKKYSEGCLKKCTEECLKKCTEKGEHKCIVKCKMLKGEGDAKEKKIMIIIKDDDKEKGDKEKVKKIVVCPGHGELQDKDIEKYIREIKISEVKEGKCCKHVIIWNEKEGKEGDEPKIVEIEESEEGEGTEPKIVKIKEGKEGEEEKEIVIVKKGEGAGLAKNIKTELISENIVALDVLNKIKESVKTLQGKLPELCKVNTELSETTQKIIIDCPMDKPDSETCKTAQKNIEAFEKEFKTFFPEKEGKKPLMKKMYIKLDVKEEKK
jgi:hypothetical protein